MKLSIVIVNYRTPGLVEDCLTTLVPELPEDCRVVLVDNASGDGSAEKLRQFVDARGYDRVVRIVESERNGGFAAGNNVGIRALDAEAYLLLNSDTLVKPGAIRTLLAVKDAHPDFGIFVPRIENGRGELDENVFAMPRPLSELLRGANVEILQRALARYSVRIPVRNQPFEPEWAGFACALVRREVFDRIGLLDERYFMYFEDVNFARRARAAGFRIRYSPEATIVHLLGGSSKFTRQGETAPAPRYAYESRARFFAETYGRKGLVAANLAFTAGRFLGRLRDFVTRRPPSGRKNELHDIWLDTLHPFRSHRHS